MNMIVFCAILFFIGICALVWFLLRSGQEYAKWQELEEPKESFWSCYMAFLKRPLEKRRSEKELYRKRKEALPSEERSYVNPYGKVLIRDSLLLLLAGLLFLLTLWLFKVDSVDGFWGETLRILLATLLMVTWLLLVRQLYRVLVSALAFGKFRGFKKRNPGKAFDVQYFLEQNKADNGAYSPEDFGRKR